MHSSFRHAVAPPRRWPLPPATELLLQTGGDGRLVCDPATGLTAYGSAITPRPHTACLSSCTASSISAAGYEAADAARRRLAQAALDGDVPAELARQGASIRAAIARHFGVPEGGAAILAASGTDAELLCLAIAAQPGRAVVNLLVAPEESGSGVPFAAAGCHFAEVTATGQSVRRGAPIAGCPAVTVRAVAGRDAAGSVRANRAVIRECEAAVREAETAGAFTLLHLLDGSKTGYVLPDPSDVCRLVRRHAATMRVVVDACQARGGPDRVAGWLREGWIVQVTGSKFYGGPPFAGAVLVPPALAAGLASLTLPEGLSAYSTRADWPETALPASSLPEPGNPGLLLRWHAALSGMSSYAAIPPALRSARLARFATAVPGLIAARPELRLLPAPAIVGLAQTVFSFAVLRDGEALSLEDARKLHRWLNMDLSAYLANLSRAERRLASRLCLIGQPVALPGQAVLRIAAGARPGSASLANVRLVLDKISLILIHWSVINDSK